MNDDYPNIPNFDEQVAAIDTIAKTMTPTRNKGNVTAFMQVVEKTFKEKRWDFSAYCKKVTIDNYEKRQKRKAAGKADETATNFGEEMKNLLDNMADPSVKSAK